MYSFSTNAIAKKHICLVKLYPYGNKINDVDDKLGLWPHSYSKLISKYIIWNAMKWKPKTIKLLKKT